MIWRLPHPVRGIVAFVLVWIGGAALVAFGVGIPEMLVLTILASIAFVLASRRTPSEGVS